MPCVNQMYGKSNLMYWCMWNDVMIWKLLWNKYSFIHSIFLFRQERTTVAEMDRRGSGPHAVSQCLPHTERGAPGLPFVWCCRRVGETFLHIWTAHSNLSGIHCDVFSRKDAQEEVSGLGICGLQTFSVDFSNVIIYHKTSTRFCCVLM